MARTPSRRASRTTPDAPPKNEPSGWDTLPLRTQHLIAVLVLIVVSVAFYSPLLFGGKTLIGSDAVKWRMMAESMLQHHETTGEEPLWSTNAFSGMPGYMVTYMANIPQIDTLATWARKVVWPMSHVLFLLMGVYVAVFTAVRKPLAAVLSAVTFAFTTYLPVILVAGHNSKFIALCFAPWLIVAYQWARAYPKVWAGLLFAIVLSINLRAGHIQITYYMAWLLGIWWLSDGIRAVRANQGAAFGRSTAVLAMGGVLALLMVAYPYLMNAEYKAFTIRGETSSVGGVEEAFRYAMAWSQGPSELLTLGIANAFGGGGMTYWGPKIFTAGPHYVGGLVLLLAGIALWRRPHASILPLGIALGMMLLFSLGEYFETFNRLFYNYFPLFASFRVPETWLSVVALVLSLLAGWGVYAVIEAREPNTQRGVLLAGGGAVALLLVLALGGSSMLAFEKEGERTDFAQQVAQANQVSPDDPRVLQFVEEQLSQIRTERIGAFQSDAWRTFFVLAFAVALISLYYRKMIPGWALQAALVLIVVVDVFGVGRRYFNETHLVPKQDISAQIPRFAFDTFILDQVQEAGGPGHFRVLSLEGNPTTNARPSFFYESLGGYHGAKLRVYQDYLDHLLFTPEGLPSETALRMMGARYVVARGIMPGWNPVWTDPDPQQGWVVSEDPNHAGRAFLVSEVIEVPDAPTAIARMQSAGFDPTRQALVYPSAGVSTTPVDSSSTAAATLEAYGPREIRYRVSSDAPRLLVLSEVYYPGGWTATVNGTETPIHQVNHVLRGVSVPAGDSEVVLQFAPARFTLGLQIAGASTALVYLLLGVTGVMAWRRRREQEA